MKRFFAKMTAMLCAAALLGGLPVPQAAAETALRDAGLDYTETTETIQNPGVGYTTTLWYRCKPGATPVHDPAGSVVLMFIDLGAFSSGENGTKDGDAYTPGTDYPLDDAFFAGLRGTMANCRRNGATIALRFRYDDDGTRDPEPASFDTLKGHIRQIEESGILEEYQDILMFVESGFVGCYGEQWGGKYCSLENKAELLDLLLDVVPAPIPVTVRTPNIYEKWVTLYGAGEDADPARAARIGMYDDGYMGSDSDLGTYSDRARQTDWLRQQTYTSYFGGEFSGSIDFAMQYDTWRPENAIPEMYKTHLSYINRNILKLYQEHPYKTEYAPAGLDTSAYEGQTAYKFIRDHLGYRFVLRKSAALPEVEQGGTLQVAFSLENTGFAVPVMELTPELLLEQDGRYVRLPLPALGDTLRTSAHVAQELTVHLPCSITPGEWNIYYKLSVGENTASQTAMRSVRFANNGTWHAGLGANLLGSVTITPTENDENKCILAELPMYELNRQQVFDGAISNDCETENLVGASDTAKLWLSNDEDYLYFRAWFPDAGEAPVFNLQLDNVDNGEHYWMYFAKSGFVYYNHGDYTGSMRKNTENTMEIRVPLGDVMGLAIGTELKNVRFFLQDEANEWKLLSDVQKCSYILTGGFPVYTGKRTVALQPGQSLPLSVETGAKEPAYQWYLNGEAIPGETGQTMTAQPAVGTYAVRVESAGGSVYMVPVCEVTAVLGAADLPGDVNLDGSVTVADAVLLWRYLLTRETALPCWTNADLDGSGTLTAADLSALKRLVQTNIQ